MGKVIVKSLRKTAKVTEDSHLDFRELIPLTDKSISVDDKCNGCGICAKVYPAGNVKLIENEIKKIGLTRIQLFVQMSNRIARKMYYECGYKRLRGNEKGEVLEKNCKSHINYLA